MVVVASLWSAPWIVDILEAETVVVGAVVVVSLGEEHDEQLLHLLKRNPDLALGIAKFMLIFPFCQIFETAITAALSASDSR